MKKKVHFIGIDELDSLPEKEENGSALNFEEDW